MALTKTKFNVTEREVVIAHMAAELGWAPRLFSTLPRRTEELVEDFVRLSHDGMTSGAAVDDFRAKYDAHAFEEGDNPYLITMQDAGLSLQDFWCNAELRQRHDSQKQRVKLVVEMMRALWGLHAGGIEQGDNHCGNVCLLEGADLSVRATVIDFGRSRFVGRSHFVGRGEKRVESIALLPELVVERIRFLDAFLTFLGIGRLKEYLRFTVMMNPEDWAGPLQRVLELKSSARVVKKKKKTSVAEKKKAAPAVEEKKKCCVLCQGNESNRWYMEDNVCIGCYNRGFRLGDKREALERYYSSEAVDAYLTLVHTLPRSRRGVVQEQEQEQEQEPRRRLKRKIAPANASAVDISVLLSLQAEQKRARTGDSAPPPGPPPLVD